VGLVAVQEAPEMAAAEVVTTHRALYRATQALRTSHRYHQPF
jgi:hypothetical protein